MTTPQKKPYSPVKMDDVPNNDVDATDKEEKKKGESVDAMSAEQKMYYYCRRGKTSEIKEVAKQVADINARDEEGTKLVPYITKNTALHYAVLSGSLDTVKVMFHLEARLDVMNKLKSTPLHLAASLGYTEIVKYLLGLKADVEAKNIVQNTPLHCAIYAGHVDTVKVLLDEFDDPRQALMSPLNGVGMSPVRYTFHDDMKKYLKQFFPKKNNDDDDNNNDNNPIKRDDDDNRNKSNNTNYNNYASSKKSNGNDVQEEEEEEEEPNETTKLTGTATATEQ